MLRRYNWAKELVDAGYAAIAPDALKSTGSTLHLPDIFFRK